MVDQVHTFNAEWFTSMLGVGVGPERDVLGGGRGIESAWLATGCSASLFWPQTLIFLIRDVYLRAVLLGCGLQL